MTEDQASAKRRLGLMVRVVRMADRKLIVLLAVTLVLSAVAGAMQSLGLKWLIDASVEQRWATAIAAVAVGGVGAGLLGAAGRAMGDTEHVVTNEVGLLIDRNSLEMTASIAGIEHLENPAFLDKLSLVRSGGPALMRAVFTVTRTLSLAITMAASLWLLATVHPLLLLTPICAIPTAVLVPRSERYVDAAKAEAAERQRAATHLHALFLKPTSAMELRVFNAAGWLDRRADELWRDVANVALRGAVKSALVASLGWLALTIGYVAALLFTSYLALDGRATVGDIVLVAQLALIIRGTVAQTADAARRAAAALRTADRFLWLEDLHREANARYPGRTAPPEQLQTGIELQDLSFTYPNTDVPVLADLNLKIEPGTTIALVGNKGAGKSTLVKLLTGMYQPTKGRIVIDGTDLVELDIGQWRARASGTFQDFVRLETDAHTTIGIGDLQQIDNTERVLLAAQRGGASPVIARLPDGLQTKLGKTYQDGQELSGGQWQRLAISRGMMPAQPLLLVLDEPTAALDPAAEQELFAHYRTTAAEVGQDGAITVLISHRFSSVAMADHIVVLDHGTVVELGTHEDLMARGGYYAKMYRKQADAYG